MDRLMTLVALCGVAGCTQPNPAFDDIAASEAADQSEVGEEDTLDEDAGTKGDGDTAGDGDSDTTGDGDGDGESTGDGDGDTTGDGDGDPVCDFVDRDPVTFAISTPEDFCPEQTEIYALVDWSLAANGMVPGQQCFGVGCEQCEPEVSFGIPGYGPLVELYNILDGGGVSSCVAIQGVELYDEDSFGCRYASGSVYEMTYPLGPVFVSNRDGAPLTSDGLYAFGQTPPPTPTAQVVTECPCDDFWADEPVEGECCGNSGDTPHEFAMTFSQQEVVPGVVYGVQVGNQIEWYLDIAQAQKIPSCDGTSVETSWTLTRTF